MLLVVLFQKLQRVHHRVLPVRSVIRPHPRRVACSIKERGFVMVMVRRLVLCKHRQTMFARLPVLYIQMMVLVRRI